MNIQWSRQPPYSWSCLWNLKLFSAFLLFLERYVFAYFKSNYIWICRQIPPWKEMKEEFSIKFQTENLCFCLRWKLNKTQTAQIRNNAIFKHMHQIIRAYPRSKKICIDQWLWKYHCILVKIWVNRSVGKLNWFVPNTFWGLRVGVTPGKVCYFYSLFKLGNSILSTLTKNCYININISFSWKLVI